MGTARRTVAKWDGLSAAALRKRWKRSDVNLYGRVDSTNAAAKDLAEKGARGGAIVVCREQSNGRGRNEHRWYSPRDAGLYLSMIFRPHDLSHPAPVSILAGVGIVGRLERAFPELRPRLKWPNDLMADDRKFGGILAEAAWVDSSPRFLVVGVGINVCPLGAGAPAAVRRGATAMEEVLGSEVRLIEVADAVIEGLALHMGSPPAALSPALLEQVDRYDWLRDRRATLTLPGEEEGAAGTCVGIAPDGALLFRPDRGALRRVPDGTIEVER